MRYVFQQSGLSLPDYIGLDGKIRPIRHASEFWDHYGVTVHEEYQEIGNLILLSRSGVYPSHIGIVIGEDTYVHSPGLDDTQVTMAKISEVKQPVSHHDSVAKTLYATNPIGYKAPVVPHPNPSYRYHQKVI